MVQETQFRAQIRLPEFVKGGQIVCWTIKNKVKMQFMAVNMQEKVLIYFLKP
jgi:hypothetical protein